MEKLGKNKLKEVTLVVAGFSVAMIFSACEKTPVENPAPLGVLEKPAPLEVSEKPAVSSEGFAAPQQGKDVGNKIMEISALNQDNQMRNLSQLIAGKNSLVYFYSSCCGHCNQQLAKFSTMKDKLAQNSIEMVGVQYLGNTQICKVNAERYQFPGNILLDPKGEICGQFGVGDFTILTLDSQGIIQFRGNADDAAVIEKSLKI